MYILLLIIITLITYEIIGLNNLWIHFYYKLNIINLLPFFMVYIIYSLFIIQFLIDNLLLFIIINENIKYFLKYGLQNYIMIDFHMYLKKK